MMKGEKLISQLSYQKSIAENPFQIFLDGRIFELKEVSIKKITNPVKRPTLRGRVFFSDSFSYRLCGSIEDASAIPLLSKTMLGPNSEFQEIKIKTGVKENQKNRKVLFTVNLTNWIQKSSKLILNTQILKSEYCK